jgi:hypothetical protein
MYTDEQIRQADAALKLLHGRSGFTYGHELWQVMSHAGKDAHAMRSKMVKELGLILREGDNYQITEEGEKAYEMGFRAWLQEQERKALEPKKMILVEKKFLGLNRGEWIAIAGIAIGLLSFLAGFLG